MPVSRCAVKFPLRTYDSKSCCSLSRVVPYAPSTAIAEHQVMHERPRLAVKNALLVSLVVVRRISANRKECFQRQHFHLTQQVKVAEFGRADEHVIARELK